MQEHHVSAFPSSLFLSVPLLGSWSVTQTFTHFLRGKVIGPLSHAVRCVLSALMCSHYSSTRDQTAMDQLWPLCIRLIMSVPATRLLVGMSHVSISRKATWEWMIKSAPEDRFHQLLAEFSGVPAFVDFDCVACVPANQIWPSSDGLRVGLFCTHTSAFVSHEVFICYQSDFLSQIFISNQSSWLNLKSEPSSINHITCFTPIMPALISHRDETPPWVHI